MKQSLSGFALFILFIAVVRNQSTTSTNNIPSNTTTTSPIKQSGDVLTEIPVIGSPSSAEGTALPTNSTTVSPILAETNITTQLPDTLAPTTPTTSPASFSENSSATYSPTALSPSTLPTETAPSDNSSTTALPIQVPDNSSTSTPPTTFDNTSTIPFPTTAPIETPSPSPSPSPSPVTSSPMTFPVTTGCFVNNEVKRFGVNKLRVILSPTELQLTGYRTEATRTGALQQETVQFCIRFPITYDSEGIIFGPACGALNESFTSTDFLSLSCMRVADARYISRPGTPSNTLDLISSGDADFCPFRKYVINDLLFTRDSSCVSCNCSARPFPSRCLSANSTSSVLVEGSIQSTVQISYNQRDGGSDLIISLWQNGVSMCTSYNAAVDPVQRLITLSGNCGSVFSNRSVEDTYFYCAGQEATYYYELRSGRTELSVLSDSCQSRRDMLLNTFSVSSTRCAASCGCAAPPQIEPQVTALQNISCFSATNTMTVPGVKLQVELAITKTQLHLKIDSNSSISYCFSYTILPGGNLILRSSCSNVAGSNIASNYLLDDLDCTVGDLATNGEYKVSTELRNSIPVVRFIAVQDSCALRASILTQSSFSQRANTTCRVCSCSVFQRVPQIQSLTAEERSELSCPLILPNVGRAEIDPKLTQKTDSIISSSVSVVQLKGFYLTYWGVLRRSSETQSTVRYDIMGNLFDSNFEFASQLVTFQSINATEATSPRVVVTASGLTFFCWIVPSARQMTSSPQHTSYSIMIAQASSPQQLSPATVLYTYESLDLWPVTLQTIDSGRQMVVIYKANLLQQMGMTWTVNGIRLNEKGVMSGGGPFRINKQRDRIGFDASPAIVLDFSNSFWVVWQEFKNYSPIRTKRFNKDGKLEVAEGNLYMSKFSYSGVNLAPAGDDKVIGYPNRQVVTYPTGSLISQPDGSRLFVLAWMFLDMDTSINSLLMPEMNIWNVEFQIFNQNGDPTSNRKRLFRYTGIQFDVSSAPTGSSVQGTFVEGPKMFPDAGQLLNQGFTLTWQQAYGYNRPYRVYVQEFDASGTAYYESVLINLDNPVGSETYPSSMTAVKTNQVVIPIAYMTGETVSLALPVGGTSLINPLTAPLSLSFLLLTSFNFLPDTIITPSKNTTTDSGIIVLTEEEYEAGTLETASLSTPITITSPLTGLMVTFWSESIGGGMKSLYALFFNNQYLPTYQVRIADLPDVSDLSAATMDNTFFVITWRSYTQIRVMIYYFTPTIASRLLSPPVYRVIANSPVNQAVRSVLSAPVVVSLALNNRYAVAWANTTGGNTTIHVQLLQAGTTYYELRLPIASQFQSLSMDANKRGDVIYLVWSEGEITVIQTVVIRVMLNSLIRTNATLVAVGPDVHPLSIKVKSIDDSSSTSSLSSSSLFSPVLVKYLVFYGRRPDQISVNLLQYNTTTTTTSSSPISTTPAIVLNKPQSILQTSIDLETTDIRQSSFDVVGINDYSFLLAYSNGSHIKTLTFRRDNSGQVIPDSSSSQAPCTRFDFPSANINPQVKLVSNPQALLNNGSVYIALTWNNVIPDASFSDVYNYVIQVNSGAQVLRSTLAPVVTLPPVVVPTDPMTSSPNPTPTSSSLPTPTRNHPTTPASANVATGNNVKNSGGEGGGGGGGGGRLSGGQIAGIVIAILIICSLLAVAVFFAIKKFGASEWSGFGSSHDRVEQTELTTMKENLVDSI